jgi:hypothetical protein
MTYFQFLEEHYGAFVGYVVGGVFVTVISTIVVREVCYRRFGIDVCPGAAGGFSQARQRRQISEDQRAAMEIAQQEQQANRREDLCKRRSERRAKYEVFLKPKYCICVSEKDLVSCNPKHDIEIGSVPSSDDTSTSSNSVNPAIEPSIPPRVGLAATEDNLLLTLPTTTANGQARQVEASCSICLMQYEVGDSVIWSTRKACPHAFHDECILSWLEKGKKRCPCCRNFFVPGKSVDDKKFIVDDDYTDETINEELDGNNENEESIIQEIRRSVQASDGASPRRRNSHEPMAHQPLAPLAPEAELIEPSNTH